jgi:hypothetical protein
MDQARSIDQLNVDAGKVHHAIRSHRGIAGKAAIAAATGLTVERVADVIRRINRGDTGHTRVEYGPLKIHQGPGAGTTVWGWRAMNLKQHHALMDHADEHSAKVELGVRRSRLLRLLNAQGIKGAERIVANIETRLGVSVEAMSETDLQAFTELLTEDEIVELLEPEA